MVYNYRVEGGDIGLSVICAGDADSALIEACRRAGLVSHADLAARHILTSSICGADIWYVGAGVGGLVEKLRREANGCYFVFRMA